VAPSTRLLDIIGDMLGISIISTTPNENLSTYWLHIFIFFLFIFFFMITIPFYFFFFGFFLLSLAFSGRVYLFIYFIQHANNLYNDNGGGGNLANWVYRFDLTRIY